MKIGRNIAITLVCIILGIMLAWQYKSINYNQSMASFQNKRTEELKDELIKLQNTNNDLRTRLQELQQDNREYENARAGDDISTQQLKKQLESARIFAGLTEVKGKGLLITLEDNGFVTVQDVDILNMINELRASGAQAISVNEERIVAISEIREAGKYIMINGKQMVSPYVIKAISDPDKLERSLKILGGVVEKLEEYQLKVDIKADEEIVIPKVRDDGTVIKTDLLTPIQ